MDKKLIAIIVAAVVVVAGVGVYFLATDGSDNSKASIDSSLFIYGNANNDYTIDNNDKDVAESIIKGESGYTLAKYPLADANCDGTVNSDDVAIIQKLINRQSCTVYVANQVDTSDDAGYEKCSVSYPLKNIVTINPDMTLLATEIGASDCVTAYLAKAYGLEVSVYGDDTLALGSGRQLSESVYQSIINRDSAVDGGIGAVLVMNTSALKGYGDDLTTGGIPVMVLKCTDPLLSIDAAVTLGFLLGGEYEDKGYEFGNMSLSVLDEISNTTSVLTDANTVDVLSLTMNYYITQTKSQYTVTTELAGANNSTTIVGTGSDKLTSAETIMNYDVDYLVSFNTMGIGIMSSADIIDTWEFEKLSMISSSNAYPEDTFYINTSMPTAVRVAYLAEYFYPDLFANGYADSVFQKFVDTFMPFLDGTQADNDFDVSSDCTAMITYSDYTAAKS